MRNFQSLCFVKSTIGGAMHLWNEKQDDIMSCVAEKLKDEQK
jgi:hypothetical protein